MNYTGVDEVNWPFNYFWSKNEGKTFTFYSIQMTKYPYFLMFGGTIFIVSKYGLV